MVISIILDFVGFLQGLSPRNPHGFAQQAETVAKTQLWIFHGERDGNVLNKMDRAMVSRLWELDAPVRYMEYPDSGHGIWGRVYSDDSVMKWFFSRRRISNLTK